jgi:hypothetical protein
VHASKMAIFMMPAIMGRYGYREESTVETVDKLMSVSVIARWMVTRTALLASHAMHMPPIWLSAQRSVIKASITGNHGQGRIDVDDKNGKTLILSKKRY